MKLYVLEHRSIIAGHRWSRWYPFTRTHWSRREAKARMYRLTSKADAGVAFRITTWAKVK